MSARGIGLAVIGALVLAGGSTASAIEPPSSPARAGRVAPPRTELYLSFVGDVMQHERNIEMPDYDRLYDPVRRMLFVDDLSFANIEFPVDPARPPAGYPLFNGSIAYLRSALGAGFSVLALANNHTFDYGISSITASWAVYDELSDELVIHHNGIRAHRGAPIEPTTIVYGGRIIGFVSITSFSNVWGSEPFIYLVPYWNAAARASFLASVREWADRYDLLVVAIHAGEEYVLEPDADKAAFFREVADAGADIVWGHHPHVLQPWERRGESVVMHSTGNFVSAQRRAQSPWLPFGRWAPTGDTAVYRVRVEWSDHGRTVSDVRTPFFTVRDDPTHGLVLKSFAGLLREPMPLEWRAFYLARYSVLHRSLRASASD
ncbi:MAG: CapA family protein [Spirochaetaceae bacterium]|nr:MAG: CapA family protein [Spirochaetaceae bacterium]